METLLVYQNGSSHKFWKINTSENSFTVTYGKVGTVGAVQTKQFHSAEECEKEAEKLIRSKLKKGYTPVDHSESVVKESSMTEEAFWSLFDTAKKKGNDIDEQLEWLIYHLSKRPIQDIVEFDYLLRTYHHSSYSSALWAAAYITMGGCSEDSFEGFRAWLIFQGKAVFEAVIQDPEAIIPSLHQLEDGEVPELEDLLYASASAYEEKTGLEFEQYDNLYDHLKDGLDVLPDIEFDWDEDDEEALQQRFPKLWELYGEAPLG